MPEAGNRAGIKMMFIEIIRRHKWERIRAKHFRCKRCNMLLEIRVKSREWERSNFRWGSRALGRQNTYLLTDPESPAVYLGITTSKYEVSNELSKEHSCAQRLIRKALV